MKKLFLAFSIVFLLSCSKDEKTSSIPAIVGIWKPISEIHLNRETNQSTNELEPCEDLSRYSFNNSGVLTATVYFGSVLTQCENFNLQGTYSLTNGQLSFIFANNTDGPYSVSFSNNNNTMTTRLSDGPYDITTVYTRVN